MNYIIIFILAIIGGALGALLHYIYRRKLQTEKTYTRKDLIRAQEIYHENYNEEPDVFKPIFTKAGALYHMNYILGIIDSNSYKMKMTVPDSPPPRKITTEG